MGSRQQTNFKQLKELVLKLHDRKCIFPSNKNVKQHLCGVKKLISGGMLKG